MSYILVTDDSHSHPFYGISPDGTRIPLIFEDAYAALKSVSYRDPWGNEHLSGHTSGGYKAVKAEGEGLRRYIEWANLSVTEVKKWLKRDKAATP